LLLKRVGFRNRQHILFNEKRINTGLLLPPNSRKIQKKNQVSLSPLEA